MGTNSGESDARNLAAESIRSGVESPGGCVKLKTVTEITQSFLEQSCTYFTVFMANLKICVGLATNNNDFFPVWDFERMQHICN